MHCHALGAIMGKNLSNEDRKQVIKSHFSALEFIDMPILLEQLRDTMLKHPMHPALNVTSRPPTKEEISRAPLHHTLSWQKKGESVEKSLVDNPDLFQLGVPFNVKFSPYLSCDTGSPATYSGEVKFSLFGIPGKHAVSRVVLVVRLLARHRHPGRLAP